MLESFLLFLTINAVLITIELTLSRLILLLLIAVAVLRGYKRLKQELPNDKLMISPLPAQIERLVVVDLLAEVLSLLHHPQSLTTYLCYFLGTGAAVGAACFFSLRTIFIAFFNLMVVLQIRRGFHLKW